MPDALRSHAVELVGLRRQRFKIVEVAGEHETAAFRPIWFRSDSAQFGDMLTLFEKGSERSFDLRGVVPLISNFAAAGGAPVSRGPLRMLGSICHAYPLGK